MPSDVNAPERVTEIASLLRPHPPRRLPESLTAAATAGDIECMKLFLDRGANLEERSVGFASPLGAACSFGQSDAIRWLIAHGSLVDPPGALVSPIQSALGKANCEAAELLLDAGLPIERAAWGVVAAASLGKLEMMRWLLGRGLELDRSYAQVGVLREKALASAEKGGHAEIVRFLRGEIDSGPPPATPPSSPSPRRDLLLAAPDDRLRLLDEALELVRAGGKPAARWKATGPTATKRELLLSHAAGNGSEEIVRALLDAGAPPDLAVEGTAPPLARAAAEAQVEVIRLLLERGALPDGVDGKSWLPLVGAAMSGQLEVVELLLEAGANPRAKPAGGPSMAEHARGPYAPEIRALLERAAGAKRAPKPKQ